MRVLDKAGLIRYEHEGDGTRPEIERGDLRAILLASFPSHLIHCGATVTDIISVGGGRHEVTVTSGYSFTTDLLIGADGAWSRVRPVTSDAKPAYFGISFVETHLKKADQEYPEAGRLVGQGSMFALSDEKGLIAHRETSGDIRVYIALKADELWVSSGEIDFEDSTSAKAALLGHFAGWNDALRALIADGDEFVPRRIHALPVGHRWDRIAGVTLIGDAAHLMSHFAGKGANQAMLDGAELGQAIVANPADIEAAPASYEKAMFPRSAAHAGASASNLTVAFEPDAPRGFLDLMMSYQQ